jgi:DNA-binding GntR family transcriptional regulator
MQTVTTLANKAYWHLRGMLLSGELPPGAQISYKPIGKQIGASVTPVREAIGKLASEGLVDIVPNLGAVVKTISKDEAFELFEVREWLETFAVREAVSRISRRQLEDLRRLVDRMRELAQKFRDLGDARMPDELLAPFHESDMAFHMTIIEAAHNRYLEKMISNCHVLSRIFESQRREKFNLSLVVHAYAFHRRIYRAIARKDSEQAVHWMSEHIRRGLNEAIKWMEDEREESWWKMPPSV